LVIDLSDTSTWQTAVEDLTKIHRSQSRILSNFAQRPLPEDAEEKTKFLFSLKTSQVRESFQPWLRVICPQFIC